MSSQSDHQQASKHESLQVRVTASPPLAPTVLQMALSNADSAHRSNLAMLPRRGAHVYLDVQERRIRNLKREFGMAA